MKLRVSALANEQLLVHKQPHQPRQSLSSSQKGTNDSRLFVD
jgi:hypothetical protein